MPRACRFAPSGLRVASAATFAHCRSSPSPASSAHAREEAGVRGKICAALERLKPILIDQIMLQMGWPVMGLRLKLKDVLVWCLVFTLAPR